MSLLTYYATFSRAGALWPYKTAYQRGAGEYRPGELAVLGGQLELLPGNLCGSGNLKLSAVPERGGSRLAAGDWVRVFLSDSGVPLYLGEVGQEAWEEGAGELKLLSLKDKVAAAAWRSDVDTDGVTVLPLKARFKPYLQAVLARATLPPGITVGSIADVNAVLKALTLFELVGDAMQAALPAAAGATWGVNPLGEIVVHQLQGTLTHRFPRTRSDRPPGTRDDYKNCVRFEYARPDGVRAFFEYKASLEVASFGEAWLSESLPASVTTTQSNPYADQQAYVQRRLLYAGNPQANTMQTLSAPAMSSSWAGHLGDGLPELTARWGSQLTSSMGGEQITVLNTGNTYAYLRVLNAAVAVDVFHTTGAAIGMAVVYDSNAGGYALYPGLECSVTYEPSAMQAYQDSHAGANPHGFEVQPMSPYADTSTLITHAAELASVPPLRVTVSNPASSTDSGSTTPYTPPSWTVSAEIQIGLDQYYQWHAGDAINTDSLVSGVSVLAVGSTVPVALNRLDDDAETGRRVWALPSDIQLARLILTATPLSSWVGVAIADQAALTAYAYGLLRYKMQPVRSWVGKYKTLRRLEVSGIARFGAAHGDVDLDVTRGVYDLGSLQASIEAGTPQPLDDTEALDLGFQSVERILRTPGGPK